MITAVILVLGSYRMTYAKAPQLVVWMTNGDKVYYDLEDLPVTTFNDGKLTIQSNSLYVSYSLAKTLRYTYELSGSNMECVLDNEIHILQRGNELAFENLKSGVSVQVFSLNGILIDSKVADGNNQMLISLENYTPGMYLIRVGDVVYKFIKR